MLNPPAAAPATNPDGRGAPEVSLDAQTWCGRYPNAPRPYQVAPTVFPPFTVGHSGYPAGHSLIAALTAECLAQVRPTHAAALRELARRIGMNRMIAGLHFRHQITAGQLSACNYCLTWINPRSIPSRGF